SNNHNSSNHNSNHNSSNHNHNNNHNHSNSRNHSNLHLHSNKKPRLNKYLINLTLQNRFMFRSHYPRKERSGNGLADLIAQGAKIFKVIGENKENIKNVAEAAGSVVTAAKKIKD
uniref:Senescence domain-containing protein n=1 Tax=Macrostomum lignano TaxID=282301 RepID=A0A1I8FTY6_9PLAT